MTSDFDTIREAILFCCADNEPKDRTDEQIVADMDADQGNALAALARVEAAAERAERERDELIRKGLTDLTDTARKLERAEGERDEARQLQAVDDNLGSWESPPGDFQCVGRIQTILNLKDDRVKLAFLEAVIWDYLLWEPRKKGHAAAHERLRAAVASPAPKEGT